MPVNTALKTVTPVILNTELLRRMDMEAKRKQVSRSCLIRLIMSDYLDAREATRQA
jgi:metal-responsive CopG/Arc/MetJ family transcriptional regulator